MNKKKKKSKLIYVYIGIIIVLLIAIFSMDKLQGETVNALYGKPEKELNAATKQILNDPNYQNIILPEELDQKIEDKEDFLVYMFSSSCIYCKATTPQIMPIVNELGIDLLQFNLLEFPYSKKYNVEYTPTLIAFEDGVEVERIVGGVADEEGSPQGATLEEFRAFFEKYKK